MRVSVWCLDGCQEGAPSLCGWAARAVLRKEQMASAQTVLAKCWTRRTCGMREGAMHETEHPERLL